MKYCRMGKRAASGLACVLAAGSLRAQSYYPGWSSYVGGDWDSDSAYAVATDSQTNTFIGGFLGQGDIRNDDNVYDTGTYQGGRDGFVCKVNRSGQIVWYTSLGYEGSKNEVITGLAVHTNGTGYACGQFERKLDSGTDAALISFTLASGHTNWLASVGNFGGTNAYTAVAVASNGYVYAAGYTTVSNLSAVSGYPVGGVTYGTQLKGSTDAFVAKYAPNGTRLWLHYLGGTNADAATSCALGPDGSVYVGGETRSPGWVTVASGSPTPSNPDGFIAKLTADGTNVWSAYIGGGAADAVSALARDLTTNALYLGGGTASTNFVTGAATLNSHAGGTDGFVLRLTDLGSSFQTNWCRFVGGGAADRVNALAVQPDGTITAGGATASSAWLPSADNAYRGGTQDGFLLRLDSGGSPLWSTYVGGAKSDTVRAVAASGPSLFAGGETFSPDNVSNWVNGGFWPDWNKSYWGVEPDYDADLSYALLATWTAEQGDPPDVTDDPDDLTVNEGARASFSVAATGYTPLYYRWYRNGAPVTGLTSNTYAIAAAARTNNQDVYTCLVSNLFGTATSQGARLTVISNATLTVTLAPAAAVAQGARWRLTGGSAWLASGASTNLVPGAYGVTFTNLTGWLAPAAFTDLTLAAGQTVATSGVYTAILPAAQRTVTVTNVSVAVQAPAGLSTWTLVETLQAGLTPTNITGGGVWSGAARTLTFTGVEAYTGTVSYTVLCVTSGVYTVSGTVAAQPSGLSVAVTGPSQIVKANLVRTIRGTVVTITVIQTSSSFIWSVTESVPAGLTPDNITGTNAYWDAEAREISWYKRGVGETLTYEVSGDPGTYTLSGIGHVTASDEPIFGDSVVTITAPEPPPAPTILGFVPLAGTNACSLTFTSVVNQAYVVLTNATLRATNGWATCLPVTGEAGTTQRHVPMAGPTLFYRVRVQ
jgi:hypothetical protein